MFAISMEKKGWGIFGWPGFLFLYSIWSFCFTIWTIESVPTSFWLGCYILPTETVCTISILPPRRAAGTPLCATVQAGQNGHLDDGQEGMTRFVLCNKKKTVVVLLDNMKNSSSSTVITVSRNCPRAPDDCSMKAGVEPEIPRCSCLPHIRTVQKLLKINKHRRW